MTKYKKIILLVGLLLVILVVTIVSTNDVMPWNKAEAIETTLSWGSLANIPKTAQNLVVKTKGGALSRQFIIEFTTDETSLEAWVNASSRLKQATPKTNSTNNLFYDIHPGENNSFGGSVTIDKILHKVTIDMSWS